MATATAPAHTPPGAIFVAEATEKPKKNDDSPAPNLLILLHGAGGSPGPFARLAAKLALPGTAALALRAPFPLGPGTTWYEEGACEAGDATSLAAARPALAGAIDRVGWPRHRVHLFGYGDGGCAALDLCVAAAGGELGAGPPGSVGGGRRWGSCVTVGSTLMPAQARSILEGGVRASPPPSTATTTPILMTRGEGDITDAPADLAAATVAALAAAGLGGARLFTVPGKAGGMLGPSQVEVREVMGHWARCLSGPVPGGFEEVVVAHGAAG